MNVENLKAAVSLAQKVGHVFIATADSEGLPHLTAAAHIEPTDGDEVAVTEWFCPGTVANLQKNKNVSITVWSRDQNAGYQLIGLVQKIDDVGVLDGFAPEREGSRPMPQVEKRLLIKIAKVLDFTLGPHSDIEE